LVFPSNWELSAGRSASVVHLFTKEGIDPHQMASIGFGEYRPIADNSTPEGRNKNRRVVIVILESESAERLFSDRAEKTDDKSKAVVGLPPEKPLKNIDTKAIDITVPPQIK
jgi:chemotaxis protein MotB